ncbi:Allantoinase [Camellia lanceoleosa]|uniref:Allantoinase n=1 Tax=Camellia lanceoleosa TaxID=1840588 RepID=A0ACC0G5M9_9ERIC|nr:Allantoinase [Camellia lanceoleosa]
MRILIPNMVASFTEVKLVKVDFLTREGFWDFGLVLFVLSSFESDDESEEESECGLTTLVDMPLNSFPSIVSKETFELKIKAAAKRIYLDVGMLLELYMRNLIF